MKQEWDRIVSEPFARESSQQWSSQTPVVANSHVYWRPMFRPDVAVSLDWDAKIGNGWDGWGNQELEYYTAAPENAF